MFRAIVLAIAIASSVPPLASAARADTSGVLIAAEVMGMYKAFRDFCEKSGSILKPSERDAIYAFAEKFGYAHGNRFDTIAGGHSERYMSRWRLLGASAQCAEAEINLQDMVKKLSK